MGCTRHDVVVVGAGPAGLSAAAELTRLGADVVLLEAGPSAHDRDRIDPHTVVRGVGGAGLYSDGKFSFYPSATALWSLADPASLDLAWATTRDFLASFGIVAPHHAESPRSFAIASPSSSAPEDHWCRKDYPSIYVPLDVRAAITDALVSQITERNRVRTGVRLIAATRGATASAPVRLDVLDDGHPQTIEASTVVLATGRFLPISLDAIAAGLDIRSRFRRVEIGLRIEDDADSPFFTQLAGVDPKLVLRDTADAIEWRTFCCCRNGEVISSQSEEFWSTSGRADGPPTGRSNLGLNVRILDPERALRLLPSALEGARGHTIALPLWPLLSGADTDRDALVERVGDEIATLLLEGMSRLIDALAGRPSPSAIVHAPGLEGLGSYPDDDGCLQLSEHAWVAGDGGGRFRGIVAAMVSGRFVAHRITRGS